MEGSPVASTQIKNRARHEWWSVHVEAWRRSGLSRRIYCRQHRLTEKTFGRWLVRIEGVEALRAKAELAREAKRNKAPRWSSDARSRAVQAFWAMHVEALTWSGLSFANYASALRLPEKSLRRWRERLETGEVEIDWRRRLHPSALPLLSSAASTSANGSSAPNGLTEPNATEADRRSNRRWFSDADKLAIVLESVAPGVKAIEVCRRHDIVTSMLSRWRVQFGYGKEQARLATVALTNGVATLADLLPIPDGMRAVDLPDGRRVFAPADADLAAVIGHVLSQDAAR
jgi:transposase-like protein